MNNREIGMVWAIVILSLVILGSFSACSTWRAYCVSDAECKAVARSDQ